MKKEEGNIGEYTAISICMLLMTVLLVAYMDSVSLIAVKEDINEICRKYILRMESEGYLSEADSVELQKELEAAGAKQIKLSGTTFSRVGYGEEIVLHLRGSLGEGHDFMEKRVSTAKY